MRPLLAEDDRLAVYESSAGTAMRRRNPLTEEWVLTSPGRLLRPWQGAQGSPDPLKLPSHDPECFLCPGNKRQSGSANPRYEELHVFPNDFPALSSDAFGSRRTSGDALLQEERVAGECYVVCYSPDHSAHLGSLSPAQIRGIVSAWADLTARLLDTYQWVQIFENRGTAMGASSPHPHCQVWATSFVPTLGAREAGTQLRYHAGTGRSLILDYIARERRTGARVVYDNGAWVAVVPYWASWPYELLLAPSAATSRLDELDTDQTAALAEALTTIARLYDNVFDAAFPYSFGWHQAPAALSDGWQLHAHYYPPLLRGPTVRKHMVGFELLSESQRDFTPESAAERLRDAMPPATEPRDPVAT